MIQTYISRSGAVSARMGEKQLHSGFDPHKEARRFVETEFQQIPRTVIVIGPGLGYVLQALEEARPNCRTIAFFLSPGCLEAAVHGGSDSWSPQSGISPEEFLFTRLSELESASLTVTEWPPATACFPEMAATVRNAVSGVFHQHTSSLATEGANGRRWLSNLVRNFLAAETIVQPSVSGPTRAAACLIAAAGVSLEDSLEDIRPLRSAVSLWALGSAVEAVVAAGYTPDVVVSTDAALFASEYVRLQLTDKACTSVIAAPLTASRGISEAARFWPVSQGDRCEGMLLPDNWTQVPAHGTAAGTAIGLARSLARWPVVLMGLDLAWSDVRSHARPHVAEVYERSSENRLSTRLSSLYPTARRMKHIDGPWRTNEQLRVYGTWFQNNLSGSNIPISRMRPTPVAAGIRETTANALSGFPAEYPIPRFDRSESLPLTLRRKAILRMLGRCRDELEALQHTENPEAVLSPLQDHLLRRLALDGLIRWHRDRSEIDLRDAARSALDTIRSIGEIAT